MFLESIVTPKSQNHTCTWSNLFHLHFCLCLSAHFIHTSTGEIESYQANPLIEDIIHLGGWPVIEGSDWNEKSFDWITMTGKMRTKGFNHNILVAIFVGPDFKDSTKNRAQV